MLPLLRLRRQLPETARRFRQFVGSSAPIALIIAAGAKLFSYWHADKLVLSMHDAQEVDEHSAPELVAIVSKLARL